MVADELQNQAPLRPPLQTQHRYCSIIYTLNIGMNENRDELRGARDLQSVVNHKLPVMASQIVHALTLQHSPNSRQSRAANI